MLQGDKCKVCGKGRIVERTNRATGKKFLACSNYPECNHVIGNSDDISTFKCGCGEFLIKKFNRKDHTYFLGCTDYPICRYTQKGDTEEDDLQGMTDAATVWGK